MATAAPKKAPVKKTAEPSSSATARSKTTKTATDSLAVKKKPAAAPATPPAGPAVTKSVCKSKVEPVTAKAATTKKAAAQPVAAKRLPAANSTNKTATVQPPAVNSTPKPVAKRTPKKTVEKAQLDNATGPVEQPQPVLAIEPAVESKQPVAYVPPVIKPGGKSLKSMTPRSSEVTQMGVEPIWDEQPEDTGRATALTKAFVWYNYFHTKKDAKECIIDWLTRVDRTNDAKAYAKVADNDVNMTLGWACRCHLRGLELKESEFMRIETHVKEAIARAATAVEEKRAEAAAAPTGPQPTIQDRLRERISEAAGELDGIFDEFVKNGAKLNADVKPLSLFRTMNVAPQMISVIKGIWNRRLDEFNEAVAGKDAQLVEGYKHFGRVQLRSLVKFAELVIADCDSYVQLKKADRKPRAKKPVSPEKLAAKFKFQATADDLAIKSESPARLVGASEAWLYDTKKRKLIHVIADQHVGSFTIKGASIVGFDATNSVQKTLRKPPEQLKSIVAAGKPAARKLFKDIKSTEVKFNGRSNENLLIIKAW